MGLPEYQVTGIEEKEGYVRIRASYTGTVMCPHCEGKQLRIKRPANPPAAARELGNEVFSAGTGDQKMALPRLPAQFLAAVSRHSAAGQSHRTVSPQRLPEAL